MTYIYNTPSRGEMIDMLMSEGDLTYRGVKLVIDHLEQLTQDLGEPIEFDLVAIRCDFSEYDNAVDACNDLIPGADVDAPEDAYAQLDATGIEYLSDSSFDAIVILNNTI